MSQKENFITRLVSKKSEAEQKLQGFGARIRKNVIEGQRKWRDGEMGYYDSVDIFK